MCSEVKIDELTVLRCWRSPILDRFKTHRLQLLSFMSVHQTLPWMWQLFNSIYLSDSLLLSSNHSTQWQDNEKCCEIWSATNKSGCLVAFLFFFFISTSQWTGQRQGYVLRFRFKPQYFFHIFDTIPRVSLSLFGILKFSLEHKWLADFLSFAVLKLSAYFTLRKHILRRATISQSETWMKMLAFKMSNLYFSFPVL